MTGADAHLEPDRLDGGVDLYEIDEDLWIVDDSL